MIRRRWCLALLWSLVVSAYLVLAQDQKSRLNLSAAAGGQMPYLRYAQGIAFDGLLGHFGDRNRMPLIPAVTALAYHSDWDTFVDRASSFAVATSLIVLACVAAPAYASLSLASATAFALVAAFLVFLPLASFVQADLAYHGLFFCTWWAMARLVQRPTRARAAACGVLFAVTYLTKASATLGLAVLVAILLLRGLLGVCRRTSARVRSDAGARSPSPVRLVAGDGGDSGNALGETRQPTSMASPTLRRGGDAQAAAVVSAVFLVCTSPYLVNNFLRFGRPFYNVNTTYFVWCDNWPQAKGFMDRYGLDRPFPSAPTDALPGPGTYWRTHTLRQMFSRLVYGCRTLGAIARDAVVVRVVALLIVGCLVLGVADVPLAVRLGRSYRWPIVLTSALLACYFLAYAWYVVVGYGDRFVLSLVLPAAFGAFWILDRFASPRLARWSGACFGALAVTTGSWAAWTARNQPSSLFVAFYNEESREELRRGNLREAQRGFEGVIRLDPTNAAAHRDLGMIALAEAKYADAVAALSTAARLDPESADVQNSLGSAWIQAGHPREAIAALESATRLDPSLAVAWYNLGGAHVLLGEPAEAHPALRRLRSLSPALAEQLEELIRTGNQTRGPADP